MTSTSVQDEVCEFVREIIAARSGEQLSIASRPVDFASAHREIERLVLEAAKRLVVGETLILGSERLPFEMRLHLRNRDGSSIVLYSDIEGDPETLRVERFRRAFDDKCPLVQQIKARR